MQIKIHSSATLNIDNHQKSPIFITKPDKRQIDKRDGMKCVSGGAPLPADGAAEARRQDLHGEETLAHAGGPRRRHRHRSAKFQVRISVGTRRSPTDKKK